MSTTTTLGYHHDQVEYAQEVRDHVARHASKTRMEWRAGLLGLEVEDEDDTEGAGEDEEEWEDDEDEREGVSSEQSDD